MNMSTLTDTSTCFDLVSGKVSCTCVGGSLDIPPAAAFAEDLDTPRKDVL
jgi:hypothetical protein